MPLQPRAAVSSTPPTSGSSIQTADAAAIRGKTAASRKMLL